MPHHPWTKKLGCTCKGNYYGLTAVDGMQGLSDYQQMHKLTRMPSLFEFISFAFSTGNLLSGPCFEIRDYLEYVERTGPWDPKNKVPSSNAPGFIRFVKALVCLGGHMYLLNFFPVSALEGEGFKRSTFARK